MLRLVAFATTAFVGLWLIASACGGGDETPVVQVYPDYSSETYSDLATWLCHPDIDDVCDESLEATVIHADGSIEVEPFEPAEDPSIDCFYVYPTVSVDPGANSDLIPDPDFEGLTARNQVARLAAHCRIYAPVYRQVTLTALIERLGGDSSSGVDAGQIAFDSLLDAWKHYIANENEGRGFVLVGHSQGASVLRRLMQQEIDENDVLRGRLVSALLLGTTVAVPEGADVGGDFTNIPLCRDAGETGCVISYASFLNSAPPPEDGFFGRASTGVAACTNPAGLAGGKGTLRPYFESDRSGGPFNERAFVRTVEEPWVEGQEIDTPWVTLPDFVEAECVVRDGASYLEITVLAGPADPRTSDIGGEVPLPSFGLHIIDANLGMGDFVAIIGRQAEAYNSN